MVCLFGRHESFLKWGGRALSELSGDAECQLHGRDLARGFFDRWFQHLVSEWCTTGERIGCRCPSNAIDLRNPVTVIGAVARGYLIVALGLSMTTSPIGAQSCDAPHYRWSAKTSVPVADQSPRRTTITQMLTSWSQPPLGPGPAYWCAARVGRERAIYSVDGWLRFADTTKDDGDWHLELTKRPDDPREQCIVVEIPAPQWSATFGAPRATLDSVLRSARTRLGPHGRLDTPLHLRVIGAPFFDAEHLHGQKRPRVQGHGHCNSSLLALWEIHPVIRLERPPGTAQSQN